MRPAALVLVVFALAGSLVACGSGKKQSTTSSGPSPQAQIKANWESFFSSATPASKKPSLLQNGSHFTPVIQAFANNPLAKNVTAKVSKVTLDGPTQATVVYTLNLGSTPAFKNIRGGAVKQNGQWKVSDNSICQLVALGGNAPSICKKP